MRHNLFIEVTDSLMICFPLSSQTVPDLQEESFTYHSFAIWLHSTDAEGEKHEYKLS